MSYHVAGDVEEDRPKGECRRMKKNEGAILDSRRVPGEFQECLVESYVVYIKHKWVQNYRPNESPRL